MRTTLLRRMLLMPASDHRPRLVEPILRGIAHPHTALTPEELAQVRADLELAEPKPCGFHYWLRRGDGTIVPFNAECGKVAAQQSLLACGRVTYRCAEHVANGDKNPFTGNPVTWEYCPFCQMRNPLGTHVVARLPL